VNPGEIWHLDDGSLRLVLSNATYNSSRLNRVITAVVGTPPTEFDPFAVATPLGTVYADRIATHPRHWLTDLVGTVTDDALQTVRQHVSFLLCQP
jgi:mRNA-degrading endonuclease toxin of MazEF toxin-antitoxin module